MPAKFQLHEFDLPESAAGQRLDQALVAQLPQYSRARLQRWITSGAVQLAGRKAKASERLWGGEHVAVRAEYLPDETVAPEAMDLDIVHEDAAILVINKPAGMVVHPGAGNRTHTLQNALLAHDPALARVPRAGLVHRLDKDTSGLLVVARTPEAHRALVRELQEHLVERNYLALCLGRPTAGGTIDDPIGRHRTQRTRMTVRSDGRPAVTHFRIEERFRGHTLLRVQLETGRTHQIRVHLAHVGFPIAGDPDYGGRRRQVAGASSEVQAALQGFRRQALHAQRLSLTHPESGERLAFEAPIPQDLRALLAVLRADAEDA